MKNHELLDIIGDVNEDHVLEAADNATRPRFDWKTLAACAACAALVLGTYPIWHGAQSKPALADSALTAGDTAPQLHAYTIVDGGALTTQGEEKAAPGGGEAPAPAPGAPEAANAADRGIKENGADGSRYSAGGQDALGSNTLPGGAFVGDAPVQEYAADQYDKLMRGLGGQNEGEPETYPDWFAGAWIDGEALTVAVVGGITSEREAEITGWCGSGVVFQGAKYSHSFLDGLMKPVATLLDGTGLACGIGVDVVANCLGVDLYSDGAEIPDSILAELARLDPAGDAIRVRLFTQSMSTLTDEVKKGPAPGRSAVDPVYSGERAEPRVEDSQPAATPGGIDELPGEKYDALKEADAQSQAEYDIIEGE